MATRGPKPTPPKLKLVRGNPGKRKLPDPKTLLDPPLDEPMPPEHLSDEAKVEWGRVIGTLVTLKLMTKLDRATLAAYCQAYGLWVQAERALATMAEKDQLTKALMIKTASGNAIQNPLVGIANKAKADMMRYAVEFGMTPSARARVHAGQGANDNPFEAFRSAS